MGENYKGGFEDLDVWKEARLYRMSIFKLVLIFPSDEKYKLTDQLIRSSRSVTSNIAEGYGRYHYQENIQSCRMARGSLTETLDHLICAMDQNYIDVNKLTEFRQQFEVILRLLNGYIAYLKRRKDEDGNK
jgi:four helix bundle protein